MDLLQVELIPARLLVIAAAAVLALAIIAIENRLKRG